MTAGEHDRSVGPLAAGEPRRLLDQLGDAGRVVDRAVVDAVAVRVGQADAEMVPVAGVDHRLVGTCVLPGRRPTTLFEEVMIAVLAASVALSAP